MPSRDRGKGWQGEGAHYPVGSYQYGSPTKFGAPPPIRGPIEVLAYTDSDSNDDDEEEEPNDVTSLREQFAAPRLRLNNMDERVAETEIDRMELGDRVDTLCKAVCSKIKHLAKATGNEDLYCGGTTQTNWARVH